MSKQHKNDPLIAYKSAAKREVENYLLLTHDEENTIIQPLEKQKKAGIHLVFATLVGIVCFILGVASSNHIGGNAKVDPDLEDLLAYYEVLKNNWYFGDEELYAQLILQAIKSMRDTAIDPYTYYIAPPQIGSGNGGGGPVEPTKYGLGVTIFISTDTPNVSNSEKIINELGLVITDIYLNSPAGRAGLKIGDRIIGVTRQGEEKIDLIGQKYGNITDLLRGVKNYSMVLDIITFEGERMDVEVTMGSSSVNYVSEIPVNDCDTCYGIKVSQFDSSDTGTITSEVDSYLRQFNKSEQTQTDLIIDLRDNPGGYVSLFANMANLFLPKGLPLAMYEYKDGTKEVACSTKNNQKYEFNSITLLMNQNSASASEAFALALRHYHENGGFKFQIVGQRTYGKGIAQTTAPVGTSGGSIYYTFAKMYDPTGTFSIHGVGINPDIEITTPYYTPGNGIEYLASIQAEVDLAGQAALHLE